MIGTMDTRSYASTATGRSDFVTPELTPEQHKLLLELRRRRQEILLEIQSERKYVKFFYEEENRELCGKTYNTFDLFEIPEAK
uniref:Uncharacterized protein n=1 Tax=Glossina palpalis gambiensis TaxID=67801 RepID=A0A1B0BSC2_9MUSC